MTDSVDRLYEAVLAAKHADPAISRTSRLLHAGRAKMAKKLGEEAFEVVIGAMHANAEAVVRESADLLYNLVVLWVSAGVSPEDVLEGNEPARAAVRHRREDAQVARREGAPAPRGADHATDAEAPLTPRQSIMIVPPAAVDFRGHRR